MLSIIELASRAEGSSAVGEPPRLRDRQPLDPKQYSNGFFRTQSIEAEDGTDGRVLRIGPRYVSQGWTQLDFPLTRMPPNPVFRARIGFVNSAGRSSDGAYYEVAVAYYVGAQRKEALLHVGHKTYTGALDELNLELSPMATAADRGELQLILRVGAGRSPDHDSLLWIEPRIESGVGDPYEFDLEFGHFGIVKKNESKDEPTVLIRGAWLSGDALDVDELGEFQPLLITPKRFGPKGGKIPRDRGHHRIRWRPIRADNKLLGPEAALALSRLSLTVLFTERDNSESSKRDHAEHIATKLLRLTLRDGILGAILLATRNLTRRAPRATFDSFASQYRTWVRQAVAVGYEMTITHGSNKDDMVGAAGFETTLLDLLLAERSGLWIQLNGGGSGRGRYYMTGRIKLAGPSNFGGVRRGHRRRG